MLLGCQCCLIFPFLQLHLQTGIVTICLKEFILWIIAELITAEKEEKIKMNKMKSLETI